MARPLARRDLLVLGGLLGAGGGVSWVLRATRPQGRDIGDTPVVRAMFAEPAPLTGAGDGSLQLAIFSDFNCPVCRRGEPALREALASDGDVCARHLLWPIFGDDSRDAARVALAADDLGLFAPVHDRLMAGPRASLRTALDAVAASGGDPALVRAMLDRSLARIDGQLSRYAFHAFSLGLQGTPSFVGGTIRVEGAPDPGQWRRLFRQMRRL